MWIADGWKDYELLDCGGGEKLERWGDQILVRPDPQAIWESDRKNRGWRTTAAPAPAAATGTKTSCRRTGPSPIKTSASRSSP